MFSQLITATRTILSQWSQSGLSSTYAEAKQESHDFALYKKTLKRQWVGQKADLAGLLSNITTKLKTYNMRPYIPPPGLSLIVSSVRSLCMYSSLTRLLDVGHRQSVAGTAKWRGRSVTRHQRQHPRDQGAAPTEIRRSRQCLRKASAVYLRRPGFSRWPFRRSTDTNRSTCWTGV